MKRCVAILGANGFIGRHQIRALLEAGHEVVATVRSQQAALAVPVGSTVRVVGNPHDTQCWSDTLGDCCTVIHLIGLAHASADAAKGQGGLFQRVNVDITRKVVDACLQADVQRLVYVSSIKAVGEGDSGPYTENSECSPEGPYGKSKRDAEMLIQALTTGTPLSACIVRPPLVYGAGARGNLARMMSLVAGGMPLPTRCLHAQRSMVYVENLADAIRCLVDAEQATRGTYHVVDEEPPLSTREMFRELARHMNRHLVEIPVPGLLLRAAASLIGMRAEAERLTRSLVVEATRLPVEIGWQQPYSRREGLDEMVQAYLQARNIR